MDERRFDMLAAAYVRGCALETGAPELPRGSRTRRWRSWTRRSWPHCSGPGAASGLKLHAFKGHEDPPAPGEEGPRFPARTGL